MAWDGNRGGDGGWDPAQPIPKYHLQMKPCGAHMLACACVNQVTGVGELIIGRIGVGMDSEERAWCRHSDGFAASYFICYNCCDLKDIKWSTKP